MPGGLQPLADGVALPRFANDGVVDRLAVARSQTTVVSRWLVMPARRYGVGRSARG